MPVTGSVRNIGALINAAQRYSAQLYSPPKQTIRGISVDSWYSPLQPVAPVAPAGTEPRGFQYYAGQNLNWVPRFDAEYTAQQLKQLGAYPLARICIESVKDVVCKAPWQIDPRVNPGESRKHALERGKNDKNIIGLTRFFEKPDREHYWNEWLRPLLDDMLVIDAASILMRRNFNGDMAELVVLRGESIVRYIDMNGLTPMAPDPAYAQIWWGIPIVNLSTDQLLYKPRSIVPRNTIASQMYGMSPTEQLAPELEIGWERLGFTKAYYTEGSIPGMMQIVPRSVSPEKMTEAMLSFNSDLAGNYAKRWQIRMVPGFADSTKGEKDEIVLTKAPLLADAYDELHTRRVTFGYGVSPQRLMKQMNRASAEQSDEAAQEEGTLQYFVWLKGVMDQLIQEKFGMEGYEWTPDPFREPSFEKLTKAASDIMKVPVFSPNEIRDKFGEEPRPEPEANQLGAMTANGWTPIGMNATLSGIQVDEKGKVSYTGGTNDTGPGKSGEVGALPAGGGEEQSGSNVEPDEKEEGGGAGKKMKVRKPNGAIHARGKRINGDGRPHGEQNMYGFAAAAVAPSVEKYSEDQPRDYHGRFGETGGAAQTKGNITNKTKQRLMKNVPVSVQAKVSKALDYLDERHVPENANVYVKKIGAINNAAGQKNVEVFAVTKGSNVWVNENYLHNQNAEELACTFRHEFVHVANPKMPGAMGEAHAWSTEAGFAKSWSEKTEGETKASFEAAHNVALKRVKQYSRM